MDSPESLRLQDYKDTDLLFILRDLQDGGDPVSSELLAYKVFPAAFNGSKKRSQHAVRCVSIRMAWLKRYGVVVKVPPPKEMKPKPQHALWELTPEGMLFLEGKVSPATQQLLDNMAETQLLAATEVLSRRYVMSGDMASTLMRRMWTHGMYQRKL